MEWAKHNNTGYAGNSVFDALVAQNEDKLRFCHAI
jgi:hypothetical protein